MTNNQLTVDALRDQLAARYQIKCFVDLGSLTIAPGLIDKCLNDHYQDAYDPDDRLVFYTCESVTDQLLARLYQATEIIDISNCFILICSPYLPEQSTILEKNSFFDQTKFDTLTVDLESTLPLLTHFAVPDTICPLPWMHLEISHSGSVRPCCIFAGSIGNIKNTPIGDLFQNDAMTQLRQDFLDNKKPDGCKTCWKNESTSLRSNRLSHLQLLKKDLLSDLLHSPKITSLDLKPGNTCNFKCRICDPTNSSLYAEERSKYFKFDLTKTDNWSDNSNCLHQIAQLLPTLTNIDMYGGEPFLIKKFSTILKEAIDKDYAKRIRLHYNSNGSIFPDHLIDLWRHFKHVDIQFSIDAIEDRFELERGGQWSVVNHNIQKLLALNLPNLKISIMPAISIMNILYLDELLKWAESLQLPINPLYVDSPQEFSIRNLTSEAKQLVFQKYQDCQWPEMQKILNTILHSPDNNGQGFRTLTAHFDQIRNQQFGDSHKEIADAMQYTGHLTK